MPDTIPPSPPKTELSSSPSIFAYQTRLMGKSSSGSPSLAALADASPPANSSTASARLGRVNSVRDNDNIGGLRRSGSGARIGLGLSHGRGSKSVDLVRGHWEAKITEAAADAGDSNPSTPRAATRGAFSPNSSSASGRPPTLVSSPVANFQGTVPNSNPGQGAMDTDVSWRFRGANLGQRAVKRATVDGVNGWTSSNISDRTTFPKPPAVAEPHSVGSESISNPHKRPTSGASYTSVLSPSSTGTSVSSRKQSAEDTLAEARANALRRLEARKRAEGGRSELIAVPPKVEISALKRYSPDIVPTKEIVPSVPVKLASVNSRPLLSDDLFTPIDSNKAVPSSKEDDKVSKVTASRPPLSSTAASGNVSSLASRFGSASISAQPPPSSFALTSSTASGGKYGSISRTDRRRLGRHLPRIASGDQGWDSDIPVPAHGRLPSLTKERKSSMGKSAGAPAVPSAENTPPKRRNDTSSPVISYSPSVIHNKSTAISNMSEKLPASRPDILAPSSNENRAKLSTVPSTPSKRHSTYMPQTPKSNLTVTIGAATPQPELAGVAMKGLMSALASTPARKSNQDDGDGVTGMSNRLRLSRLPLPASSATLAPAPLPSKRLANQNNWMDKQRHALAAYEYLCHVGEAQQWIEGCLEEELEFGVTEMEEGLRDGVVLAKLARVYEGAAVVKRIWTEAKHRYRQSDNINYFLNFVRNVGMPETFMFELTDLYNKKNIPKVIFCIHILSHLLARLGRAERIGNLVGQFEFTDEQLAATQKGLQGVTMPNFQQVGQSLAKEASWEPEDEIETEDELRDRLLLECETSIVSLQQHMRGKLARQRISRINAQLELTEPIFVRVQSLARGLISRRALQIDKQNYEHLHDWATSIQAVVRGQTTVHSWRKHTTNVRRSESAFVGVQAQARGLLARVRRALEENELDRAMRGVIAVQAVCRGCLARQSRHRSASAMAEVSVAHSITTVQAVLRGRLARQAVAKQYRVVEAQSATFTSLQSHLRGALVRRHRQAHEQKMDDATHYIVAIQAVARGVLARWRKQKFTRNITQILTSVASLQALARGRLAMRTHESMQKALAKVEVAGSVDGLQAFLRTKLAKRQTVEQKKKLEFVQPDVIGFQAVARGHLARQEYREWRDYLVDPHTQGALIFLQSLIRGYLARRKLWLRSSYLHQNVDKIVKIQALWRGRKQRQLYDRLITGLGVDVPTIQNYMHLLDDTETDFRDQLHIDTLRNEVVDLLRTNQTLETEVQELDTKIALILKNKLTFEELARAKRRHGGGGVAADDNFNPPGGGDPFGGVHLDRASQRKLELFEHLFFTLQTEPKYLSRLLRQLALDEGSDKERRLIEGVTLILFGFGHEQREEYLFQKLVQISVHEEILRSRSLGDLASSRLAIISVITQYVKPLLTPYLQTVLYEHVQRVTQASGLDLCVEPIEIYHRIINAEESLTGVPSALPRNLDADQVLQSHAEARTLYIQHLQELRALTDFLIKAVMQSTAQMPYTIRLLAREALLALRVRYQGVEDNELWPVVAKAVILPFILPAVIAPETYGIAETVDPMQRRNLAAIANLMSHVAAQDFTRSEKDRLVRVPLNEYIRAEGLIMGDWILDVAEVDFQVQELLESTSEPTPISITRDDIYRTLSVLIKNLPILTASKSNDPLASVLEELEGPPIDYDRGKNVVSLKLTNRLAQLHKGDPRQSQLRELEVQAKRHVIAVLRVQTGRDLYEVLLSHPSEQDEQRWVYEVHRDIALEQARLARHNLPPTPVEAEYQMESIRSLPFHEVKSRAIEFCMRLVEAGRLSRDDRFEGLLVSIASDIKEKHRLRQKRRADLRAMSEAHTHLSDKRRKFEEQIQSYHDYIDSTMAALQQKKKAPFMSRQYWHQRVEAKHGKKSKFGSYKYTAAELYEKGILLSVNQFSPRQFDKMTIIVSSNDVGIFTLEMSHPSSVGGGGPGMLGREEMRMEDLLQAQFDNNVRLDMFDGMAAFNLNMLIHQINKKFYAS